MGILDILFGIALIVIGISCVKWNYKVANSLRQLSFLSTMGGGDIYNGTKFLGVILIFIGLSLVFGLWQAIINLLFHSYSGLLN